MSSSPFRIVLTTDEKAIDEVCKTCSGMGQVMKHHQKPIISIGGTAHHEWADQCFDCRGIGFVPTQLGEAILDFVRRHGLGE